ncbi:hypothetical protein DAETH_29040 [Deinococcus aetherius]|uniref:Uncharacterized protein n=1 Tax=Deinococcus aetherius TaxID=200252 RepID=A0ABM8AGY9_9DEIO|nr:hypothetical protein DAETH_29040 [Deinococcus aetherius]
MPADDSEQGAVRDAREIEADAGRSLDAGLALFPPRSLQPALALEPQKTALALKTGETALPLETLETALTLGAGHPLSPLRSREATFASQPLLTSQPLEPARPRRARVALALADVSDLHAGDARQTRGADPPDPHPLHFA